MAEPESARLRQAMRTLADPERVVQLCDIEAMEQVRRARPDYDPDMVVPYAMAETNMRDGALVATGGAFRSRREWYELSFRCTPAADFSTSKPSNSPSATPSPTSCGRSTTSPLRKWTSSGSAFVD